MNPVTTDKKPHPNHSVPDTWVRICPRCLSTQVDLHLYGRYSQQLYKCIECGYIGVDFTQVDLLTLEKMKAENTQSEHDPSKSQRNRTEIENIFSEYRCPQCGERCTEAEVE